MKSKPRTLVALALLAASAFWLWASIAAPQGGVAQAAAPEGNVQFGVPQALWQSDGVRRESVVIAPNGQPPRTGPASPFQSLTSAPYADPIFGINYRANTDTQGPPNLAQQEPSIAVNPTNPLNVVAMAKDERGGTNTKQTWIYTSTDGGVTWLNQIFPFAPQSPFSSDPVVNFSDDGICYVTSLPYGGGTNDGIQIARSMDGGITFTPGVHLPGTNDSTDKEWTWIDNTPTSPFYHRIYTAWMDFGTGGGWRLNYSSDRGVTFSTASAFFSAYQFPMPVTLPNGDVLVSYRVASTVIGYRRSTDGGATFGNSQTISSLTSPRCPPDNSGCGIWRMNAIPVNSVNRNNSTMVVVWADGRPSPANTATIYYTRSTDNGATWSAAAILAPPGVTNTYQVEPWIEADEQGIFHAIWYDDRENPNTSIFHIYYSQSTDNGATWSTATRISTATSDLRLGIPSSYGGAAGDYIQVTAAQGNVYAAWTDTRSGTGEDIYVVRGIYNMASPTPTITGVVPTATATATRTATSTSTSTATRTNTPGLTVTSTSGVFCPVSATGASTSCTPPSTYDYSFQFNASCGIGGNATLQFEVASSSGGPWTVFDTQTFRVNFGTGANTVQGSLPESGIPAQYTWYRITISILFDDGLTTNNATNATPICSTGGPTATATSTRTNTPVTPSATPTPRPPTQTPGGPSATPEPPTSTATSTVVPSATTTLCTITFTDVDPGSEFYQYIRCLACRGIISGYDDGTFRPFNDITRSQIAKIVSNAAGFDEDPGPQVYQDVDGTNPFYQWINRLSNRGHMGGYPCGTVDAEPCIEPDNRPYFRPFANATRGQLAKIVANAAGIVDPVPAGTQTYTDVPPTNPFWEYIERLTALGVMSGYPCGGTGEPCVPPGNRPYFRPFANVTRAQGAKIIANTFYGDPCLTPSR